MLVRHSLYTTVPFLVIQKRDCWMEKDQVTFWKFSQVEYGLLGSTNCCRSQHLACGTLTQVDNSAHKVHACGNDEYGEPATMRLGHQLGCHWTTHNARNRRLKNAALHYITLHYITLHYITLHYITLHYITLHYITLHYITTDLFSIHHII